MDTRKRLTEKTRPGSYASGVVSVNRLREDGKATAAELREFVEHMHGRSPQELLGELSGSGLFRCMALATVLTMGFLVVFTVGPYYLRGAPKKPDKPAAPAAAAAAPAVANPATPAQGTTAAAPAPASAGDTPNKADLQKAAEKLDIIESKQSDPKKNPLDKDLDKLLDVKD